MSAPVTPPEEHADILYARAATETIDAITRTLAYLDDAGARMSQCWIDLHDYREQLRDLVRAIERGEGEAVHSSEAWASLVPAVDRMRAADAESREFYARPSPWDERDEEVSL